jgi:hypothetical protein
MTDQEWRVAWALTCIRVRIWKSCLPARNCTGGLGHWDRLAYDIFCATCEAGAEDIVLTSLMLIQKEMQICDAKSRSTATARTA